MSRSVLGDELTFILGPPADGELRGAFEDYQAAVSESREQDVQRYEALQREYLQDVGGEAASLGLLLNRDWCAWFAPQGD